MGAEANRGMLGAVEAALAAAEREDCEWLLTLDQDTVLPADFFFAVQAGLAAAERDQRIGVIVPHLAEQGRLLSPAYVGMGRARPLPPGFAGVPTREARAFNSAALIRVTALRSIAPFDPCFWLDHFDSWLHHQLHQQGWRMHVLGALTLEHQLSLLDYAGRVSAARYRNFLGAEAAYIDLYQSNAAALAYTAQLAIRWLNQRMRGEDLEIRAATRSELWRRMTMRKRARISAWRAGIGSQPAAMPAAPLQ
jgi:GT2 family glycosyltransferase